MQHSIRRYSSWVEKSSLHGIHDLYDSFEAKNRCLVVIWSVILIGSLIAFVTQTVLLFYNFAHEEHWWFSSVEVEVVRDLSECHFQVVNAQILAFGDSALM